MNNHPIKIAFVTSRLPLATNKKFTHILLLENIASKIQEINNYNVKVYFHGETSQDGNFSQLSNSYKNHVKSVFKNVKTYIDLTGKRTLKEIEDFAPDLIFYLGGVFESKYIRHKLYEHYPTCFLFFNQNNNIDEKIDIAISNNIRDIKNKRSDVVNKELKIPTKTFPKKISYPITKVKKNKDEIVIAAALTQNRMAHAFSNYTAHEWEQFKAVFSSNKNIRLKLLGPEDTETLLNSSDTIRELYNLGRIEIIQFEEELRSYLEHCDIFVAFPGFNGGGTGGVFARLEQCPVLCCLGSDVCLKEIPSYVEETSEGFYKTLGELVISKEKRNERAKQQFEYLKNNFVNLNKERFDSIVDECLNIFSSRSKK